MLTRDGRFKSCQCHKQVALVDAKHAATPADRRLWFGFTVFDHGFRVAFEQSLPTLHNTNGGGSGGMSESKGRVDIGYPIQIIIWIKSCRVISGERHWCYHCRRYDHDLVINLWRLIEGCQKAHVQGQFLVLLNVQGQLPQPHELNGSKFSRAWVV